MQSDKNLTQETIFELIKTASTVEDKNTIFPIIPEVFTKNIDLSIKIFRKIINDNDIKPNIKSIIGMEILKNIDNILEIKPTFIDEIYIKYYGFINFECNKYFLNNNKYKDFFDNYFICQTIPKYLKIRGIKGLKVIIGCINAIIYHRHIDRYFDESMKEKSFAQKIQKIKSLPFNFRNHRNNFIEDYCYIWDRTDEYQKTPIDYVFEYISENIKDLNNEIINLFKNNVMCGQFWSRFIELMLNDIKLYKQDLINLAVYENSLKVSLSLYQKIGTILEKIYKYLSAKQKSDLEDNILNIKNFYNNENYSQKYLQDVTEYFISIVGKNIKSDSAKQIYNNIQWRKKELKRQNKKNNLQTPSEKYIKLQYGTNLDNFQIDILSKTQEIRNFYLNNLNNTPTYETSASALNKIGQVLSNIKNNISKLNDNVEKSVLKDISNAVVKISSCSEIYKTECKYILKDFIEHLLCYKMSSFNYYDASTIDYYNSITTQNQMAQAIVLYLRKESDIDLRRKIIQLAKTKDDASILFYILQGLFPKQQVFDNKEESWNLLNIITKNILKNYKSHSELITALYYYVLYTAQFNSIKSLNIIKQLEEISTYEILCTNDIYNVPLYYFDIYCNSNENWINERQKKLLGEYNPKIYSKILNILCKNMEQNNSAILTIMNNILLKENLVNEYEDNISCIQIFLNHILYGNKNNFHQSLPILCKIITALNILIKDNLYQQIYGEILNILYGIDTYKDCDVKFVIKIINNCLKIIKKIKKQTKDVSIYWEENKLVQILSKLKYNNIKYIKKTPSLFNMYCRIINEIALFYNNVVCMKFILE